MSIRGYVLSVMLDLPMLIQSQFFMEIIVKLELFVYFLFIFAVVGIEPRASHLLTKCSTTGLDPQTTFCFLF